MSFFFLQFNSKKLRSFPGSIFVSNRLLTTSLKILALLKSLSFLSFPTVTPFIFYGSVYSGILDETAFILLAFESLAVIVQIALGVTGETSLASRVDFEMSGVFEFPLKMSGFEILSCFVGVFDLVTLWTSNRDFGGPELMISSFSDLLPNIPW